MGSEDGGRGAVESRTRQKRRQSFGGGSAGGGLAVRLAAAAVAVGVAGTLFTNLRKPKNSPEASIASDSLDKIITGDGKSSSLLEKQVSDAEHPEVAGIEGEDMPTNDAIVNGQTARSLDHDDTTIISEGEDQSYPASTDSHAQSPPEATVSNKPSTDEHSVSAVIPQHSKDTDVTTASIGLSELVNQALLSTKPESPSKHEPKLKTPALQKGIAEVLVRSFDHCGSGDMHSDEQTPTTVNLRIALETSSGLPETETAEVSAYSATGQVVADTTVDLRDCVDYSEQSASPSEELLQPNSPKTEAGEQEQVVDRVNHDAPASQDAVPSDSMLLASASSVSVSDPASAVPEELPAVQTPSIPPTQEQFNEASDQSTPAGKELSPFRESNRVSIAETQEGLLQEQLIGNANSERTEPKVVKAVQQGKIKPEKLSVIDEGVEVAVPLGDISALSLVAIGSGNDATFRKEPASPIGALVTADNEHGVSMRVASAPLPSTTLTEVTASKDVNIGESIQISMRVAEKNGTSVKPTSLVLPAASRKVTNITRITSEESTDAGSRKTAISSEAGGLKRERLNYQRSLEVLALTLLFAVIGVIVLAIKDFDDPWIHFF